jgi:hypothetical protein
VIKEEEQAAAASIKSRKTKTIVIGVVVTLVVLLLLGAAGIFLFLRRRKVQRTVKEITPRQFEAADPTQTFEETGGQILSINAFITPASPTQPRSPKSPGASTIAHSMSPSTSAGPSQFAGRSEPNHTVASSGMSVRNPGRPAAFSSFPIASVRRSAKEIEAGLPTSNSMDSEYSGETDVSSRPLVERSRSAVVITGTGPGPSGIRGPARSASMGAPVGEIIFQHQDAGIIRELPPPYADRGPREEPEAP